MPSPQGITRARHAALALVLLGLSVAARAVTVTIVSDPTWTVTDSAGNPLGNAQNVCLAPGVPASCPTGATPPPTIYGYPSPAWTDLIGFPGATWIWAPGVTGTTSPAGNVEFTFTTSFFLCGTPTSGTITIAGDNFVDVFLNGTEVASTATLLGTASFGFSPSRLSQGENIIQVKVKNGPNPADCGSDQYRCNPAGFVLAGVFTDALASWPACTGNGGKTFTVGQTEPLMCPSGKIGSASRTCICIANTALWSPTVSSCMDPPKPCTGSNGKSFNAGDVEQLSCPSGQVGAAPTSHKCQIDGTWDVALGMCMTPLTCTGATGVRFPVGAVETVSCPAGRTGTSPTTHICLANGSWDAPLGPCVLPTVVPGGICGSIDKGVTGMCTGGLDCLPRPIGVPTSSFTADWYCGDANLGLGVACVSNHDCASGHCDRGWNTSMTNLCMPAQGTGAASDLCSDNRQCASGSCDGLHPSNSGWVPGHCAAKSALGMVCNGSSNCLSGYCDRGDATSKTGQCMPATGRGQAGDWCSNNNQCARGTCLGLHTDANGNWQPGHCN